MQEINFFKTNCEFETTKVTEFGIHDELHNDIPAYLVFDAEKSNMLRVLNSKEKSVNFYPIDNCVKIYKENSKNKESTCYRRSTFITSTFFIIATFLLQIIFQLYN